MVNGGKLFMMGRSMSASMWWSRKKGGFGVRFTARVRVGEPHSRSSTTSHTPVMSESNPLNDARLVCASAGKRCPKTPLKSVRNQSSLEYRRGAQALLAARAWLSHRAVQTDPDGSCD